LILIFFAWNLYSIPALVAGFRNLTRKKNRPSKPLKTDQSKLPFVSVIVPAKNEEKVIGRLLGCLLNFNYPKSKMEIIVVDDNSIDKTCKICKEIANNHQDQIKIIRRLKSSTKAGALNYGLKFAKGDIIATFDADSLPESDGILNAIEYFNDSKVAGVQGTIYSSNSEENMLTKFISLERSLQYQVYQNGKDNLGLFVSLNGTCQFIKKSVLEEMEGWNEKNLAEDMELSLRLAEKNYKIKYALDVKTHEESPNNLSGMIKQRTRWFRGNIENMVKFGRLLKNPANKVRLDAEIQLFGNLIAVLCVLNYVMAYWTFTLSANQFLVIIMSITSFLTILVLALAGLSMMIVSKPFKITNILWLPFIYGYWALQSFIAINALILILIRRPIKWNKTTRSGIITSKEAQNTIFHTN